MKAIRLTTLCFGLAAMLAGCQPDIADGDIDLRTTYFPFGLGYEWCYERHNWYTLAGWGPDEDTSWNWYDTFSVKVTDSTWSKDTLIFYREGGPASAHHPVYVYDNKIAPTWVGWVEFFPAPTDSLSYLSKYTVSYNIDTLILSRTDYSPSEDEWYDYYETQRMKGYGAVTDGSNFWHYDLGITEYGGDRYRLLYFYNGKDTVYKVP